MDKLNLQLLGEFGLQSQEGLCIRVSSKKSRALVGYLASRPGHSVSRVELARVFWERHDEQQALTNLRQSLSVLNNQLSEFCPKWLVKESGFISLDSELFSSDIDQIRDIPASTDRPGLEIAAALFRGSFLDGLNFHEQSLMSWLDQKRQNYEIRHIEIRKQLLEHQIEEEDFAAAASNAEKLVLLDPVDERNHRRLMSIYSSLGQRHRILRQYQQCCQALEYHQIGQPQEKTVSLFQSLYYNTVIQPLFEAQSTNRAESTDSPPTPDSIPAIAVLPFHDLMDKPDSHALSTALTEEVVNELNGSAQ